MSAAKASNLALVAVAFGLTGCAGWMRYTDHLANTSHPWHAWPERAGAYIGGGPVYPLAWLEAQAFHPGGQVSFTSGVFGPLTAGAAALVAFPLGTVFYVVGYPLEWALPLEEKRRAKRDATEPSEPSEPAESEPSPSEQRCPDE